MLIDISEKVVVITGGSSGIGKEFVRKFADEGCKVIFTYLNNEISANELKAELTEQGKSVECYKVNNAVREEIDAFTRTIMKKYSKIDVLINNAGFISKGLFLNTSNEVFEKAIAVNLMGTLNYCKSVLKGMMMHRSGSIINISTISALRPSLGQSAYSISKAGIESLTYSLAQECGKYGVRINTIAPGLVATDIIESMTQKRKDKILSMTPLGRNATPEDIFNAALFLASDLSSYITGVQLLVTGGRHLL